jgi:hypothetical protein
MKRGLLILFLAPVAYASLLDADTPVTLDTGELSRIWQEVRSGASSSSPAAGDVWQSAMLAEDAELTRVLLLVWLQEQNPLLPLAAHAKDYAEAVSLHMKALSGRREACKTLALAYRVGQLGALQLAVCEQKARWYEQRAVTVENLTK